ncbi:glycerate kinase [Kordiimonas sp. SCSIO 12610]|uniref:glycerate kinase type-2 family protein n=1 Tax=Kordiimonas sp. SCSIO 12610 TaxID=2829597 RepID=UPI00210BBA35|nr:DUF4147 domain-containing protein [Kordiimonas sp. SCSIO 12610]UTW53915.1 DUF4147 domain-containing protein [Kordiimonas sp. SCSIO 12610]
MQAIMQANNQHTTGQSIHMDWRSVLEGLYGVAVAAAHPQNCLPNRLPDPSGYNSVKVIALGKAAASYAEIVETCWPDVDVTGIAVTPHAGNKISKKIEIIETSHPFPSDASVLAGDKVLEIAKSACENDLLLILLSGGASSSVALPVDGLSVTEKSEITKKLMHAGADIQELNIVRKHLSRLKGGQLAVAGQNAKQIITLAISDVVDDDPSVIGSGLTVSDPSTVKDAKEILAKYGIDYSGKFAETVNADHPVFNKCRYEIIANARFAIDYAAEFAQQLGLSPQILNYNTIGDAAINGKAQARFITRMYTRRGRRPKLLLFGGEFTSGVKGDGKGGPNQHFLLTLLNELPDDVWVYALSADTDGLDGSGNAAGAWFTPESKALMRDMKLNPEDYIANSDSNGFFNKLGTIIQANPTHTNVNDFRAVLIPALD